MALIHILKIESNYNTYTAMESLSTITQNRNVCPKRRPQKRFQSKSNDLALALEATLLRYDLLNGDKFRLPVLNPCMFPQSFPLVEFQIVDDFVNNSREAITASRPVFERDHVVVVLIG